MRTFPRPAAVPRPAAAPRRLSVPLAAALAVPLAVPLAAAPAEAAAPAVRIVKVVYDSPGKDDRSNRSLNGEYVVLRNTTKKAITLTRWILRDETGYKYRFGPFVLKPGKTVTVRTGSGRDTATTVYWNRRQYVWNNDRDTASLYRGGDLKKIHSCSWRRPGSGSVTC